MLCVCRYFARHLISCVFFSLVNCFPPAVCEECLANRLEEERRSQLEYDRAIIYVRQVDKSGLDGQLDASEDPDFQVSPSSSPCLLSVHFPRANEWKCRAHFLLAEAYVKSGGTAGDAFFLPAAFQPVCPFKTSCPEEFK